MHLATIYAPGSFLKPCLVVDTLFTSRTKETALRFQDALNSDHAFALVYANSVDRSASLKDSGWIVVQTHATRDEAIAYHLELTRHFHNGGSEEEWSEGWEPYLALYERWCPKNERDLAGA